MDEAIIQLAIQVPAVLAVGGILTYVIRLILQAWAKDRQRMADLLDYFMKKENRHA